MNINALLNRIKKRLGIFYFKLPISDKDLIDVITDDTLVTFSRYYPAYLSIPLDTSEENKIPNERYGYYINTDMLAEGVKILGIEDVTYDAQFFGGYMDPYANNVFDFMELQAGLNLSAIMNCPITWNFYNPNKIVFDEDIRGRTSKLFVTASITYSKSLANIPTSYEDEFFKLALIDIKIFLYNNLKHFDNIDTTFGQISLKIDEWNGADDERTTLVNNWDETFIYHRQKKIYNV